MVEFLSLASCVQLALLCGHLENGSLKEIGSDKRLKKEKAQFLRTASQLEGSGKSDVSAFADPVTKKL